MAVVKFTGHPLADVGVATLCALVGKDTPDVLTLDDLDKVADELSAYYFSGLMTSYLSCVFMNAEYVQPVKGKGKEKETETVNLEDLIDVKGWKALGNRLSQHKVTKVSLTEEQEDTGLEEGDDDNELIEPASVKTSAGKAAETGKGSQSSKKKEPAFSELPAGEQAGLFAEPANPKGQQQKAAHQKPKVKAEQADLFGEKPKKEKEKVNGKTPPVKKASKDKGSDQAFGVGETIELEL